MTRHIQSRRDRLHTVKSLRCAGHQYLLLASGRTHYSLFTRLMPWDHAPGVLIHREAGGAGRTLDGAAYSAARRGGGGLLLAPDDASWRALHEILFGDSPFAEG
jgi:fructose-1,6-bisphosphatase/inositol monophosphatase family enzyme